MVAREPFRFNLAFLAWSLGFVLLGAAALIALARLDRLPAPPLTATHCIDEKFKFLAETEIRAPNLIAVGSSVTWRNLDFSVLAAHYGPQLHALNAAPCFLKVNETAFLTDFYLDNMPSVRTVLTVFGMRDFDSCAGSGAFFDTRDARRYVFEHAPAWPLYFKNFRPLPFVKDVLRVRDMRSGADSFAPLVMDPYGSGPLLIEPPDVRGDMSVDPACLDRLRAMALDLRNRGVRWIVVLFPRMPAWISTFDRDGRRDAAWRAQVKASLAGSGTVLVDAQGLRLDDEHFTDPVHLRWPSVPLFMNYLSAELARVGLIGTEIAERADAL